MAPHTHGLLAWRRTLVIAVTATGLLAGAVPALAGADPASPNADAGAPVAPPMSADQALAVIANDYDSGTGGGQISNLIHKITRLRAKGFPPSVANANALVAALDRRPNQAPLIEALQATLAFQQSNQSRAMAKPQQPATIGANPGGAISLPVG